MMVICRNCERRLPETYNMYYSFCSICCCADYAAKHGLAFYEAQSIDYANYINELEEEKENLKDERDDLVYDRRTLEQEKDNLFEKIDGLKCEVKDLTAENIAFAEENEELLRIVKELKSYSDRFDLLELNVKLKE